MILTARMVKEDEAYVMLGLEIDYMSQGDSEDEVIARFVSGFNATADEHMKQYGHMNNFHKASPDDLYSIGEDEFVRDVMFAVDADYHISW